MFPIILIVLMAGAATVDATNGLWWRAVYWTCAALLNVAVLNMK